MMTCDFVVDILAFVYVFVIRNTSAFSAGARIKDGNVRGDPIDSVAHNVSPSNYVLPPNS